jgi:hypothetical protein
MRSTISKTILLLVLPIGTVAMAAPSQPTTAPTPQVGSDNSRAIDAVITRLGDADPAVRRHAADALVHMGGAARSAILAASRGDDPQIADSAAQVLRALPWSVPDDPPEVQRLLEPYGQDSVADRVGIVAQLGDLPGSEPALLRLLSDESNEDVCWQVEAQLIGRPAVKTFAAARRFDPQTSRPAALVLAGRAWLTPLTGGRSAALIDRDKATALLHRAVELEALAPTYDDGQLDFAFDQLAAAAVENHQYDQAATLRRQQCKRIGVTRTSFPSPFFELLILHSDFGPLAGFADDLQTYGGKDNDRDYLAAPESLFILSRLYSRLGQALLAHTLEQAALAASPSEETRSATTSFLLDHGWYDLATKECRATLSRANATPDEADLTARLRLSSLGANRGDEAQAAEQLRLVLDGPRPDGSERSISNGLGILRGSEAERIMRIELAEHSLHAAQAKGDSAEADRQVDQLLKLGPSDEQAAIDLVPELKARGRGAEADKLFQSAYSPLKARIDAGDLDPTLMNDTAWLCARCGEHLDEALDLSNRAVAAEPDNAAFLDTNAEAHFRKGQAAEAARMEAHALKLQPGDQFMEGQLKRFQAGSKPK